MSDLISHPFAGIDLHPKMIIGLRESQERVFQTVKRYTIHRRTRILNVPGTGKMAFRLSADGEDIILPPDDLFQRGALVTYQAFDWHSRIGPPERAGVTLPLEPVPGTVRAETDDGLIVGTAVNGRDVFIAARSVRVILRYRLRYPCIVTASLTPTVSEATGRPKGWSMELEEELGR